MSSSSRVDDNPVASGGPPRSWTSPAIAAAAGLCWIRPVIIAGSVMLGLVLMSPDVPAGEKPTSDLDYRLFDLRTAQDTDVWQPFESAPQRHPPLPHRAAAVDPHAPTDEVHAVPIPATLWGAAGVVGVLILLRHGRRRARV